MIYLDQAATSLQKPPEVCQAMLTACKTCAGYARSGHAPALRAGEVVYQCREAAAQLFSVDNPEQIIFTMNATHALNLAIHGFCTPSTVVAVSSYEHNSVMRPLHALGCPLRILRSKLFDSADFLREAEHAIDAGVQIFIINHVSNVFGSIIPLEQLDAMLQAYQIPLILDASQSAGTIPISVHRLRSLRAVCMPGHKGLLGPQGTGMLILSNPDDLPRPLLQGGTGSASSSLEQPAFLPDRLESGTPNVPGIAGLHAGMQFLLEQGIDAIHRHERDCIQTCIAALRTIPNLEVFAAEEPERQAGVLSIRIPNQSSEILAQALADRGVCVRGGLHCATLAHQSAHTQTTGTVRLSVGPYNTRLEMQRTAEISQELVGKM